MQSMTENQIGKEIVDSVLKVHRHLGPGLLESVYESVLVYELNKRGLKTERQKNIPVKYDGQLLEVGFRADIIVEDKVLLELKSIESIHDVHKKQALTYLKLSGIKLGYLINFNVSLVKDGIVRIANGLDENPTQVIL